MYAVTEKLSRFKNNETKRKKEKEDGGQRIISFHLPLKLGAQLLKRNGSRKEVRLEKSGNTKGILTKLLMRCDFQEAFKVE